MKFTRRPLIAAALLFSTQTMAQLAGHNVILVHGFQPDNLQYPPADAQAVANNGFNYWSQFWIENSEARLDWDSSQRIEGKIAEGLYNQAITLAENGLCNNGCVMVTHSTGDLVTRYFLEHQEDWLAAQGLPPLNIIATLDFAGAGGGTELADTAMSVATSDSWYNYPMKSAIETWLGFSITDANQLGVMSDLQPATARNLATTPNGIPRLRFVGAGSQFYGATGGFITGTDDGVVPTHSSCGAAQPAAFDSCSATVAFDGERTSVSAPAAFLFNHYPVLMGESIHHSGTIGDQIEGLLTYANNGFTAGLTVDFDTYIKEESSWWYGDYSYQYVTGSDQDNMSAIVFNALN